MNLIRILIEIGQEYLEDSDKNPEENELALMEIAMRILNVLFR